MLSKALPSFRLIQELLESNVCAGKNRVFLVLSKGSHLRNIIHRLGIIPQLHALLNRNLFAIQVARICS